MSGGRPPADAAGENGDSHEETNGQDVISGAEAERELSSQDASVRRGVVSAKLEEITSIAQFGPMHHPIFGKFKAEHVTQFLANVRERERDESRERRSERRFRFAYTVIAVGIFVFLTYFLLPEHSGLYFDILKGVGIFAAGLAGGYGLKAYKSGSGDR